MKKIKTLANCDEVEFLRQTNKIRKAVQNWLDILEIVKIKKENPGYQEVPEGASKEEKDSIIAKNLKLAREQSMKNLDVILDRALDEHAEETVKIMKLCCFTDPEDTTSHNIVFYMSAFTEMLKNEEVIDFFTSLVKLGKSFGLSL